MGGKSESCLCPHSCSVWVNLERSCWFRILLNMNPLIIATLLVGLVSVSDAFYLPGLAPVNFCPESKASETCHVCQLKTISLICSDVLCTSDFFGVTIIGENKPVRESAQFNRFCDSFRISLVS